jgi:hypothetical protein
VTEVGSRGAFTAVVRGSTDAKKLATVDGHLRESLVRLYQALSLSQAHLQVWAYQAQEASSRKVLECLERLGGAAAVVRDESRLRELAEELGMRIDEARADLQQVVVDKLDGVEAALLQLQRDGPHSYIPHGGAQSFWRARLSGQFKISTRDLRLALLSHLNLTDPQAATEAAKSVLRDDACWRRVAGRLEASDYGTVSVLDLGGAVELFEDVSLAEALCRLHASLEAAEEQQGGPSPAEQPRAPLRADLAKLVELVQQTAGQLAQVPDAQLEVNRGLRLLVQDELDCPRLLLIVKRSGLHGTLPPKSSLLAEAREKVEGLGEGYKSVSSCCYQVLVLCPICWKVANQDAPYSKRLSREKLRKYAPALCIALAVVKARQQTGASSRSL